MNQNKIIIPSTDIYTFEENDKNLLMFSIRMKNGKYDIIYRDLYIDLKRNDINSLKTIAKYCLISKYYSLKKQELVKLIYDNIVLEDI
jgi:hypothetical protein